MIYEFPNFRKLYYRFVCKVITLNALGINNWLIGFCFEYYITRNYYQYIYVIAILNDKYILDQIVEMNFNGTDGQRL